MDKIDELLTRGIANIIPSKNELEKLLRSGKKLNVYFGIDPTATKIHLGNAVPLRKLQTFAELFHNVIFLIGDFTTLIGDTSDKDSERPMLTSKQIQENFKTYKNQAGKILDFSKIQVKHNSEWLKKLTFAEIIKLSQQFSFGDFAARELIKKRLLSGKHVGLHEGLYPTMQGYDSYFLDTDVQIGGTDQTFNMQAGRILQKNWRKKESFILANEFLLGTDGRKMSKTWDNAIWLDDAPNDMFAKVMAINDDLIIQYFTLATNIDLSEIKKIEEELKSGKNPMEIKRKLAYTILSELYCDEDAKKSQEHFQKTVQNKQAPKVLPTYKFSGKAQTRIDDLLLLTNLAESRLQAKRLIEQGGVEIEGSKITDSNLEIEVKNDMVLKVGKRKFVKIKT